MQYNNTRRKEYDMQTADLNMFTGTEGYIRYNMPLTPKDQQMLLTDGAHYFAENCGGGAYWLMDIIQTEVVPLLTEENYFILIKMDVLQGENNKVATIVADDGNDNLLWSRDIGFTDADIGTWKFYLIDDGRQKVLMLPSEY
tara:strand:- start:785 stop:1210 length:426 start_codon:yes stop_codon:yes gene_type:complete